MIVLLTIVVLAVASFAVVLVLVLEEKPVPEVLIGITTTLFGTLTGSAVTLGASPKVAKTPDPVVPVALSAAISGPVTVPGDSGTPEDFHDEPGVAPDLSHGVPGDAEPHPDGDDGEDLTGEPEA